MGRNVQILNSMRTCSKVSGSKSEGLVLNQPEASSKWVWLPMNSDNIDLSRILVQIETAAQDLFQSETSKSTAQPLDSNSVFKRISDEMIKSNPIENTMSKLIKKNNANTAKADIKG